MERSFFSYYLNRKDLSLDEMAADPITSLKDAREEGEQSYEKRKIPILFDKYDILYLYQFPPEFWPQALARRYNEKLFNSHKGYNSAQDIPEIEDITLTGNRGNKFTFKNINTFSKKLHDKLTRDVDDDTLSGLGKDQEHKDHYSDKGGYHGYVLDNPKHSKEHNVDVSEGYVGLTKERASELISKWLKGVDSQWLSKMPEDTPREIVKRGGRGSEAYVRDGDWLSSSPLNGKMFHANPEGRPPGTVMWVGLNDKGRKKAFYSHLPVLKPGLQIDSKSVDRHDNLRKMAKKAKEGADQVHKALSENPDMHLHDALIKSLGNEYRDYMAVFEPETMRVLLSKKDELTRKLNQQGRAREGQNVSIREQSKMKHRIKEIDHISEIARDFSQNYGEVTRDNMPEVLNWIGDQIHSLADNVRDDADKYDIHDYSVHSSNLDYPKISNTTRGFGTSDPNKQQRKQVYASVQQQEDLEGNSIEPHDFKKILEPLLVQAGVMPTTEDADGPVIPYVTKRENDPRRRNKVRHIDGHNTKDGAGRHLSPLAVGIDNALKEGSVVANSPAFVSLKSNWWLIFDNAKDFLWHKIGETEFVQYLKAKLKLDKAIEEGSSRRVINQLEKDAELALHVAEKRTRELGSDYAKMVWQIKKRLHKTSLDKEALGAGGEIGSLGDFLSQEDQKLHDKTRQIVYNRVVRPGETSQPGQSGHDIQVLQQLIDEEQKEIEQRLHSAVSMSDVESVNGGSHTPEEASEEVGMMKNLINSGIAYQAYRNYYLWLKEKERKDGEAQGQQYPARAEWWEDIVREADEFATQQAAKQTGMPAYGLADRLQSTGDTSLATTETQFMKGLKDRMTVSEIRDAGDLPTGDDPQMAAARRIADFINDEENSIEQKKTKLSTLFTHARSNPQNDEIHQIAQMVMSQIGPETIASLGIDAPVVAEPTQQYSQAHLNRISIAARDPNFINKLVPGSPEFDQGKRNTFEKIVQEKGPSWQDVQTALTKADAVEFSSARRVV